MNDFILSLMLTGALASGGQLPFWTTAGQFGLMPEHNGALAVVGARTSYDPSKTFQWRWGASLAANADSGPAADFNLMVDELYASAKWKALSVDLGCKRVDLDFYGASPSLGSLSVTGGHVVWSGNARTMPGYTAWLDPVPIPLTREHVWLYGAFGDYKTLDERYIEGALVHRTKFGFRFDIGSHFRFHFGLDHYAIWAGKTQVGEMPVTFSNYFRVITGRGASTAGSMSDQLNVIGDQGGGEFWRFEYLTDDWTATFLHDIPYNDGSGMGFQNFPDGVNTLSFSFKDKDRWVSDILYEFQYTRNQSGWYHDRPTTEEERRHLDPSDQYHYWHHIRGGGDNYFNNGEYRTGWTYYGHTIGNPLFYPEGTHAGTWTSARKVLGVENNRLRAHHIGISGKLFRKAPYKLMLTYSQDYGLYGRPYLGESPWAKEPGTVEEFHLNQVYGAFTGEVPVSVFGLVSRNSVLRGMSLTWGLYADRGQVVPDNFGATLGVRWLLR
ncbi:MAG: capsule assembly Wzi family protein [Bacteroidales bacterium]|nr:capsule assembly Wzi family protein [Bacteroidales bacterium]